MRVSLEPFTRIRKRIDDWRADRAYVRSYRKFPEHQDPDRIPDSVLMQLVAEACAQYGDDDLMAEWWEETQRESNAHESPIARS
jgi:hypothetical protein